MGMTPRSLLRSFGGVVRGLHLYSGTRQRIGVIGVPYSKGQPKAGVEFGPFAIRQTGFVEELKSLGHSVTDHGDVKVDLAEDRMVGLVKNSTSIGVINKKLSDTVHEMTKQYDTCITLGGDHTLGFGSILGHARTHPDLCVLWLDAHADINTVSTTTTGNMHGMPVSFVLRELQQHNAGLPGWEWVKPCINGKDIAFIGLRDLEPLERLIIEKLNIKAFSMRDVDDLGIAEVFARAMDAINPKGNRAIHTSYDIDSLDISVSPSTGTPVPGGLTMREGLWLAEEISKTGLLKALDIVEVNPTIGSKEDAAKTSHAAKQVILSLFGNQRGGNLPQEITDIPRLDKAIHLKGA